MCITLAFPVKTNFTQVNLQEINICHWCQLTDVIVPISPVCRKPGCGAEVNVILNKFTGSIGLPGLCGGLHISQPDVILTLLQLFQHYYHQ